MFATPLNKADFKILSGSQRKHICGQKCLQEIDCPYNHYCSQSTCYLKQQGGPCDEDIQCPDYSFCVAKLCVSQSTRGPCRTDEHCFYNYFCSGNETVFGECRLAGWLGHVCEKDRQCLASYKCMLGRCSEDVGCTRTHHCADEEYCSRPSEASIGNCVADFDDGSRCTTDVECRPGSSCLKEGVTDNIGICREKTASGPCTKGSDCISTFYCRLPKTPGVSGQCANKALKGVCSTPDKCREDINYVCRENSNQTNQCQIAYFNSPCQSTYQCPATMECTNRKCSTHLSRRHLVGHACTKLRDCPLGYECKDSVCYEAPWIPLHIQRLVDCGFGTVDCPFTYMCVHGTCVQEF